MKKIYLLLLFLTGALCGASLQAMEQPTMLATVRYHRPEGIYSHHFTLSETARVFDLQNAISAKLGVPQDSLKVLVTKPAIEVDPITKKKLSVEYRKWLQPQEFLGNDTFFGVPIVQEYPMLGQPGYIAEYIVGYVPPVYDVLSTVGLTADQYPALFRQNQPFIKTTLFQFNVEPNDLFDWKK